VPTGRKLVEVLQEVVVDSCWRQWAALGAPVVPTSGRNARTIVDAEALLLMTAIATPLEARLHDVLAWWAQVGATHTSVKRLGTMARYFPHRSLSGLSEFAAEALEIGDRRWQAYAAEARPSGRSKFSSDDGTWPPKLLSEPALMLRLRAGFGHGAKTDSLTYLVGSSRAPATAASVAEATHYSTAAVRIALQDMVAAGFVSEARKRPAHYYVSSGTWSAFLFTEETRQTGHRWRHWNRLFGYIASLLAMLEESLDESEYRASSLARDLYETHREFLLLNEVPLPDPRSHPGVRYLHALEDRAAHLRAWFRKAL
jgi:hypothetical protein